MLSFSKLLVLVASASLAHTSAIPIDQSASKSLEKRAADLRCPGIDGKEYVGPKGGRWRIECRTNSLTAEYRMQYTDSFEDCIILCGSEPSRCNAVTFTGDVNSRNPCYLKSKAGTLQTQEGAKTAIKLN